MDLFNISADDLAYVQTEKEIKRLRFGYRSAAAPEKLYLNARSEGLMASPPTYTFRKDFLSSRCVVSVTSFIEGPDKEKLAKPFLISCADGRVFHLAGIYNPVTNSYCIITTTSNVVTASIGHHRSPVMLHPDCLADWLDPETELSDIHAMMSSGYYEPEMIVAPLDAALVRSGKNKTAEAMQPVGASLQFE